jgi:hypothetical protein
LRGGAFFDKKISHSALYRSESDLPRAFVAEKPNVFQGGSDEWTAWDFAKIGDPRTPRGAEEKSREEESCAEEESRAQRSGEETGEEASREETGGYATTAAPTSTASTAASTTSFDVG